MSLSINPLRNIIKRTEKETLDWFDLKQIMIRDNAGRFYAIEGTSAERYIEENGYRSPSRNWPNSHAKPLMTKKFANWLIENDYKEAISLGLIEKKMTGVEKLVLDIKEALIVQKGELEEKFTAKEDVEAEVYQFNDIPEEMTERFLKKYPKCRKTSVEIINMYQLRRLQDSICENFEEEYAA